MRYARFPLIYLVFLPLAVAAPAVEGEEPLDPAVALERLGRAVATPGTDTATVEWEASGTGAFRYTVEVVVEGPEVYFYQVNAESGGYGAVEEPTVSVWNEGDGPRRSESGDGAPFTASLEPLVDRLGAGASLAFPRLAWALRQWPPPLPQSASWSATPCGDGEIASCGELVLAWPEESVVGTYHLRETAGGWRLEGVALVTGGPGDSGPPSSAAEGPGFGEQWVTVDFQPAPQGRVDGQVAARRREVRKEANRQGEGQRAQGEVFYDQVDVRLRTFKVRALDRRGASVEGLTAEDFQVKVGTREAVVSGVDWIPAEGALAGFTPEQLEELAAAGVETEEDRFVVLFVHTSFYSHRLVGLSAMIQNLDAILGSLSPRDRLAVVSYDTHLKLRLDFTRDREAIREAMKEGMIRKPQMAIERAEGPSLLPGFDFEAAREAAFVEVGILRTLEALEPLSGDKRILLLSWGLGAEHGGLPTHHFRRMVQRAREGQVVISSVFLSNEQSNLVPSVAQVATQTGGTFINLFGDGLYRSLERLENSMEGYYQVTFEMPEGSGGQRVVLDVTGERGKEVYQVVFPGGRGSQLRWSSQ